VNSENKEEDVANQEDVVNQEAAANQEEEYIIFLCYGFATASIFFYNSNPLS
jgi:hypothetical protein